MAETIVTPETTYTILRPLGEGGMGQVLLVESPRQPEPVALKLLQPQLMTDARVEGFKREFALLSELHHPHLPRVYDFGLATSRNQYFFSTEFIEGQELYRALRQAPFEEIEHVLMQVLSALDFLHAIGLVHFDVKGENVLVKRNASGQWDARLVDFGVTSPANRELTEVAGTLHYIAPELLLPDPVADGRCDLYSFGAMCYCLLSGQFPYTFNSFDDVWEWHRSHPSIDLDPLRTRGVPDYFCQMIERLMKPNPGERFSSAGVVLNYLALHSGTSQADLPTIQRAQIAEGPFVGRTGLMATVKNALHAATKKRSRQHTAQENTPRAFLLSGRDGMGKTRFLQELKYVAQVGDYTMRIVDIHEFGDSLDRFRIALGIFNTTLSMDDSHKALIDEARIRPLCLAIDNIQDAAPTVRQFIFSLMGTLYNASLLEQAPPLVLVVTSDGDSLPATVGAVHVTMAPLSRAEVESYLRQLIGNPEDFETFCNSVWDFSGGIPLLMAEAARQYHQQSRLPASIEDLYRNELATLPPQALRILQTLAFAAVPMPAAILELVSGVSLDREILPLTQQGLLRYDDANAQYTLSTGALATVLSQDIPPELASGLADPLLAWVESSPGNTPIDAARYAPYCRDMVRASRILAQAIEMCERSGKALQAIELLSHQVAICERLGMRGEVIALRRRIATHHLYLGHLNDAEGMVKDLMAQIGSPQVEELKLMGLIYRVRRKPDEAGKFYNDALAQISPDPSDPVYLFLQNERALAHLESGNVARAIPILMQTHREAKALPFEKQRRVTNNNLGAALARAGQMDEATAFYQEKLRLFQHDLRLQGSIQSQLASVQTRAGRIEDAIQSFEAAWQIAQQTGDMHNGKIILENIIALYQKQTSYSRALHYAKKSLELKSVGSSPQDMGRTLMTLATLYLNLGVPDLAARYLIQAMRIVRRSRDHQLLGWIHINFGYLYKDLGRLMEALNAFEETMYIAEEHKDDELLHWGQYGAADVLVDHGELEEARPYMALLESVLPQMQDPEFRARVLILQNRILVMKTPKPTPETAQQIAALSEECRKNGWSELEWEVEYALGTLYQKRDEFEQVRSHLSAATKIIQTIANGLGEEYRDGFLKHRVRSRVFAELQAAERNEVYVTEVTSMSEDSVAQSEAEQLPASGEDAEVARATAVFAASGASPEAKSATGGASGKTEVSVPVIRTRDEHIHFDPGKPLIEYEREIIEATLVYYQNDVDDTARALGITPDALRWKLEQLGLSAESKPESNEHLPS